MENSIVRHIVMFQFRPEMTATQLDEIIHRFREMALKIPGTLSFEHGPNHSPEGLDRGLTHVFMVTFQDAAARDVYLVHPDHVRFATWLGGLQLTQALVVVDFTPQPVEHHT